MSLQVQFFKASKGKLTTLVMLFSMFGGLLVSGLGSLSVAQAASSSTVIGWGNNGYGQITIPAGLRDVKAISAGGEHSLALKSDGTVVAWGDNTYGQLNIPADAQGKVIAISAGGRHSLALKDDGTVVAWGDNLFGQVTIPADAQGEVKAISAGGYHSLALKSDGTVVAWGDNDFKELNIPAGLGEVTSISAGYFHSLALKSDGTVVGWGSNRYGQLDIPADAQGKVTAIAAGYTYSLALKSDGTVVAWGDNSDGQVTIPADAQGEVKAISASTSSSFNLALKKDGTVVAWGNNSNIPAGLNNVTAITAGGGHSLALYTDTTPPTTTASTTPASPDGTNGWFKSNVTVNLNATDFSGIKSITYRLNGGTSTTINAPSTSLNITTDGTTVVSYYATDTAGNVGTTKSLTIKLDKTPPTLTCQSPTPVFSVNQSNASVSATVSDALSGPASTSVSQPVDTATPGNYTVNLTGFDQAGNSSQLECGYTNRFDQSLTFPQPADHTFGEASFTLNATASSGLPVGYTTNTPTLCTVSGANVSVIAAGTCSLTASQPGNTSYNPAPNVTRTFTVNKATPTLSVTGGPFTYDGQPHPATATATGAGGTTVAGSFSFSYNPGDTNPPVNVGTYAVTANFTSSDPNYTTSTATGIITINQADQTITLSGVPATANYNTTFTPAATSSAGLPVTISVSGVCSLSNGVVKLTGGTGSCVVTASQVGNPNYKPASTSQAVTAQKTSQTINFNAPTFSYYPYPSGNNTFTVGATANSGLPVSFNASGPCSFSGSTVTVTGVGACVITATQNGDSNYSAAPLVSRTFQVVPNPTGYDLLAFGNLNVTSTRTDGPIGVLGNASFQGTNLATANTAANAVQVQGNVSFGNQGNRVNGNVIYSGSLLSKYVTFARGSLIQNPNALSSPLKNYALGVSMAWGVLPANGTVDYKPWGQIILTGSQASQNVFGVDGSKLSASNSLVINAPAGSTVILNITGTSDSLHNMGIQLNGPSASKVVYNFYQATSLTINSVKVDGTVWAANANVNLNSVQVNGSIIAGSTSDSNGNYLNAPFLGVLPAV